MYVEVRHCTEPDQLRRFDTREEVFVTIRKRFVLNYLQSYPQDLGVWHMLCLSK